MLYYQPEGRWILIEEQNEWHILSLFFTEKVCKKIKPKEIEEASVIFSLSVNALVKLIENNYIFEMPTDSVDLLNDYSFQQTNISAFVSEWCELGESLQIHSATLYEAYKSFCAENAITPTSQNLFSQKINSTDGVRNGRFRINGSNPARGFYGISLCSNHTQDSKK